MKVLSLSALPGLLAVGLSVSNPFRETVDQVPLDLMGLSATQRQNIVQASQALEGVVIKPGQTLSFNQVVGPRWSNRGFQPAPVYRKGAAESDSLGGGICAVSSLLYQLAIRQNLTIIERTPHLYPSERIPPGMDATVWYSPTHSADLKIGNSLDFPVQIHSNVSGNRLYLQFRGPHPRKPRPLRTTRTYSGRYLVVTTTAQDDKGNAHWVSTDKYVARASL
jgi:vancomycin resistance protein YoaR